MTKDTKERLEEIRLDIQRLRLKYWLQYKKQEEEVIIEVLKIFDKYM